MSPNDPTRSNLWTHASSKLIKKTQPHPKAKPPSNHSHFWPKKWFLMSFLAIMEYFSIKVSNYETPGVDLRLKRWHVET